MGDEMATAPGRASVRSPGNASRQWVLVEDKWADPYQQTPAGIALSDRTEDEVEQRVTFADNAGLSG